MFVKVLAQSLCVSFSFFSIAASAGNNQPVYSLKNLGELKSPDGVTFKRTQVKCNTRSAFAYITSQLNADKWCLEGDDSSECYETRIDAATEACFAKQAVAKTSEQVRAKPTLEARQALDQRQKLQDELLLTQQKTVELQFQQLELRKQELKLLKLKDAS